MESLVSFWMRFDEWRTQHREVGNLIPVLVAIVAAIILSYMYINVHS